MSAAGSTYKAQDKHRSIGPSLAPSQTPSKCVDDVLDAGLKSPLLMAMSEDDRAATLLAAAKLLYAWCKSYDPPRGFGPNAAVEFAIKVQKVIKFVPQELPTIPAELQNYREHMTKKGKGR